MGTIKANKIIGQTIEDLIIKNLSYLGYLGGEAICEIFKEN